MLNEAETPPIPPRCPTDQAVERCVKDSLTNLAEMDLANPLDTVKGFFNLSVTVYASPERESRDEEAS